MMKRFLALMTALMCLCFSACAESTSIDWRSWLDEDVAEPISEFFAEETIITTTGTAVPAFVTDTAVLTFSLTAEAETVSEANAQMMQTVQMLEAALVELGVAKEHIRQKAYDVESDVSYQNTKLTADRVTIGYLVEMTLAVRIEDLSSVGKVIDTAMQIGADITHDLIYESSAAEDAYRDALVTATQDAINKAGIIAESCGLKLMNLISVTEISTRQDGTAVVEIAYLAK